MGLIWFSLGLGGEILVIGDIFQIFVTFYHAVFHENLGTNQCKSGQHADAWQRDALGEQNLQDKDNQILRRGQKNSYDVS